MNMIFDYTIEHNKVLDKETAKLLFKAAKSGDRKAWEKIILSNIGIVMKCARDCKMPGIQDEDFVEDMISDGFEELVLKAMDFNEDKNVPFGCYIWQWIKQWVYRKNLPQGICLYREEKMLSKAENSLRQKLNRNPTDSEIAEKSGLTEKKINSIRNKIEVHTKVSLDDFDDEDEGKNSLYNCVSSKIPGAEEIFERKEEVLALNKALDELPEIEKTILIMRNNLGYAYDHELSLREVAAELKISREKARYTEVSARKHLAEAMKGWRLAA